MPRRRHSSTSPNRSAFPPPDHGFMIEDASASRERRRCPGPAGRRAPPDRYAGRSGRARWIRPAAPRRRRATTPRRSAVRTRAPTIARAATVAMAAAIRIVWVRVAATHTVAVATRSSAGATISRPRSPTSPATAIATAAVARTQPRRRPRHARAGSRRSDTTPRCHTGRQGPRSFRSRRSRRRPAASARRAGGGG